MGQYRVRILRSAAKEIEAISTKKERQAIIRRIAEDPRGTGCEKLAGREDRYRVRQGRHRIVYSIEDDVLTVVVVNASKVGSGRYLSASEVVRAGLRLLEHEEELLELQRTELRKAIADGVAQLDRGEAIPGQQAFDKARKALRARKTAPK